MEEFLLIRKLLETDANEETFFENRSFSPSPVPLSSIAVSSNNSGSYANFRVKDFTNNVARETFFRRDETSRVREGGREETRK